MLTAVIWACQVASNQSHSKDKFLQPRAYQTRFQALQGSYQSLSARRQGHIKVLWKWITTLHHWSNVSYLKTAVKFTLVLCKWSKDYKRIQLDQRHLQTFTKMAQTLVPRLIANQKNTNWIVSKLTHNNMFNSTRVQSTQLSQMVSRVSLALQQLKERH